MKLRWLFFLPIALLVVLVGVSVSRLTSIGSAGEEGVFASPERLAPAITAQVMEADVGGDAATETVDFGQLKGPVLVNFWATWCTPCKAEHPLLVDMKAQGAPIIGVLHKDKVEAAQQLLDRDGDPFSAVALDPQGEVSLAFGLSGVPETFLIDARGMIVKTYRGPLDGARAREFLDAWRAEVAKGAG
jgi:cytochrome c biogenesis protein CcmG/thiol:disulfide interchange protein DsbE